jgi:hypothetical protein
LLKSDVDVRNDPVRYFHVQDWVLYALMNRAHKLSSLKSLILITLISTGTLPVSTTVCPDASPLPISSPPMMSVDSSSRNDADQSHSQSKNKKKALPAKRRASALSAASPGSVRRSHAFR